METLTVRETLLECSKEPEGENLIEDTKLLLDQELWIEAAVKKYAEQKVKERDKDIKEHMIETFHLHINGNVINDMIDKTKKTKFE